MKKANRKSTDELRPEYKRSDFGVLVRGKYAARVSESSNIVVLEPQVARDAGLSRESLYKALGENGNPSFATVLKVARALGVRLHAQPA